MIEIIGTGAMPPGPRVTMEILAEHGHAVRARRLRTGCWRFSIDGSREMDAHTMARRFRHYGI